MLKSPKAWFLAAAALIAALVLLEEFGVALPEAILPGVVVGALFAFRLAATVVQPEGRSPGHRAPVWIKLAVIGGLLAIPLVLFLEWRQVPRPRWVRYVLFGWGALSALWFIMNVSHDERVRFGGRRGTGDDDDVDSPGGAIRRLRRKKRR